MDLFSDNLDVIDLGSAIRLLKESQAGFLKLFNNSPVCMSMTSTNPGKRAYARVNRKFLERFGYAESEIIGRTSVEFGILDEEESQRVGALIREKGRLQNDYVKCRAKDGEIVHTISSIEEMEMNGEKFLVSFFVDVTRIFAQQAIIEQHSRQLEAMNKELEAFSYSVSHDLRTPLRAIDGYSKILEDGYISLLDDEGRRLLLAVQRNAEKMHKLIDDLLAFARMGRQSMNKTMIDMNALVDEVLAELKGQTPDKTEVHRSDLHSVQGDYALIKQVIENLISNAIKYSSKKEKPVVEISSASNRDEVIYSVRDNGAGFDMNYAKKLFGVFQRLHTNNEFEGTGVGLATAQRIINRHGGTIHAEAEVNKGAKFWFTLTK